MRLMHRHHLAGAGRVVITSPDLPVYITATPEAEYREADILADRGLAAHVGPTGIRGVAMEVKVGRPSFLDSLKDTLGLRQGSSISGGGSSIRSTGRGSVVSGGSITHCATGDGARVFVDGKADLPSGPGVHLTVPLYCTFELKDVGAVSVLHEGRDMTIEAAAAEGILGIAR
jgi:hypothetical protein